MAGTDEIIQLKITLQGTEPPVWRRLLVERTLTFEDLHFILQAAMGWTNSHLYQFDVGRARIAFVDEDGFIDLGEVEDAADITLESMIEKPKMKFKYTYDFGDNWKHLIVVEKFLPRDAAMEYPFCSDGAMSCPPEDCGGIPGYYHLLEVVNDPKHPDHEEMREWLGGEHDPDHFDKDEVNEVLRS